MKLKPEQLGGQLGRSLAPVYLISGDEILLVQEACDQVRAAARQQGFSERELHHADNNLDWRRLYEDVQSGSLFAERKIIELHFPTGKFPDSALKFISDFCERPSEDNLLLIRSSRLDKKALSSKWAKAVDELGVIVQIWPVEAAQLPRWIEQRLQQKGMTIDPDALQLLTERVEGNLLAAQQEIEKLHILSDQTHLTLEEVNRCVVDSSRYSLFDLVDECLKGNAAHALKMLEGLQGEGVEPTLVIWALAREMRHLDGLRKKLEAGQPLDRLLNVPSIPKKRIPALSNALRRHHLPSLMELADSLREADQAIKGGKGDPWQPLKNACLKLSGRPVPDFNL